MRVPFLALLALSACTPDPDDTADTQPVVDVCAEAGLPSSYDQVSADYLALEAKSFAMGDQVMDLFHAGDIDAIWAMCSPDVQALLTKADLESVYDQVFASVPVDQLIDRRSMGVGRGMYDASTWDWQGIVLAITWGFDTEGQLSALAINQASELAEPYPDYDSTVEFTFPLDCLAYTAWGGKDELHNYHTYYAPSAYAYDFLIWQEGGSCAEPCEANEDYWIFGQPLYAPAAGTVVEAEDVHEDMPPGQKDPQGLEGNHVTLEVAPGEYLLLAHMQSGSVLVAVGDTVEQGQHIGNVGNSGNTTEAHLHIHLQDQESYGNQGQTMPQDFYDIVVDGVDMARGMPVGSTFVTRSE
jgi:hypothetical protein